MDWNARNPGKAAVHCGGRRMSIHDGSWLPTWMDSDGLRHRPINKRGPRAASPHNVLFIELITAELPHERGEQRGGTIHTFISHTLTAFLLYRQKSFGASLHAHFGRDERAAIRCISIIALSRVE